MLEVWLWFCTRSRFHISHPSAYLISQLFGYDVGADCGCVFLYLIAHANACDNGVRPMNSNLIHSFRFYSQQIQNDNISKSIHVIIVTFLFRFNSIQMPFHQKSFRLQYRQYPMLNRHWICNSIFVVRSEHLALKEPENSEMNTFEKYYEKAKNE